MQSDGNLATDEYMTIEPMERIAQIVIQPYLEVEFTEVDELNETKDLTWIDHHASVIYMYDEAMAKGGQKEIKGLRRIGTAAYCRI